MSLKIRVPARLKALYPGVALSKKSVEANTEKLTIGLTDESTDEEIDARINARNEIYSFDDQRKYDDYLAGKATKDAADKETARLKAIADGGTPPVDALIDAEMPAWAKALIDSNKALASGLEAIKGEKVTNTRKQTAAEKLKDAPESFRNDVLADMDEITFRDDDHLNSYLERKVLAAADFIQEQSNLGLTGQKPAAGFGKKTGEVKLASDTELDAVMENL